MSKIQIPNKNAYFVGVFILILYLVLWNLLLTSGMFPGSYWFPASIFIALVLDAVLFFLHTYLGIGFLTGIFSLALLVAVFIVEITIHPPSEE
jgi:hypothetical protein